MKSLGSIRKRRAYRRLPPPSARHFSARATSIRGTPQLIGFADLNQHGSHLRPTAQCESKVVDALDDLSWLNQFGSMHAVNYDPSNEILSDEHPVHVEVEL